MNSARELAGRVSTIIPAYNGAAFLSQAIESVLGQFDHAHEIIVVDDNSADDTVAIAESFASRGVRLERSPARRGLTGNWNRCLELATGEYVCVFHQDDVMRTGNLACKASMLAANPEAAFAYSAAAVIDGDGGEMPPSQARRDDLPGESRVIGSREFLGVLLERNVIRASSVVARRAALEAAGPFRNLTYLPDWEMWLRLAAKGSVGWISDPLVAVRWHVGSETHQQRCGDADLQEYERLLPEILESYAPLTKDSRVAKSRAYAAYASGCMNRAYHALSIEQDPSRARDWIKRALKASPGSAWSFAHDPRWGALAALLFTAPALARRWVARRTNSSAI